MTGFRRKRRADDGRFTQKDAKAWRGLIQAARYAMRAPLADTKSLWRAAQACTRAVAPAGHGGRDSVFLRFNLAAQTFAGMAPASRTDGGPRLLDLADACEAILNTPPPGADRRDIFG